MIKLYARWTSQFLPKESVRQKTQIAVLMLLRGTSCSEGAYHTSTLRSYGTLWSCMCTTVRMRQGVLRWQADCKVRFRTSKVLHSPWNSRTSMPSRIVTHRNHPTLDILLEWWIKRTFREITSAQYIYIVPLYLYLMRRLLREPLADEYPSMRYAFTHLRTRSLCSEIR